MRFPPPAPNVSYSTFLVVVLCLLGACVAVLAAYSWWHARGRRMGERLEKEYLDAYRQLHARLDSGLEQGRFSYRPATGELILDARAARLHGLGRLPDGAGGPQPAPGEGAKITVAGWDRLPATARAAGWIDEALSHGLAQRQPVQCEYLARTAGQADRHLVMTAIPVGSDGVLVGSVVEREGRPADFAASWRPSPPGGSGAP